MDVIWIHCYMDAIWRHSDGCNLNTLPCGRNLNTMQFGWIDSPKRALLEQGECKQLPQPIPSQGTSNYTSLMSSWVLNSPVCCFQPSLCHRLSKYPLLGSSQAGTENKTKTDWMSNKTRFFSLLALAVRSQDPSGSLNLKNKDGEWCLVLRAKEN